MYIADLHIHSRYSRATSRELTPENLELSARRKGIRLLGTGDFSHPAWRAELEEKLVPAEDGLYRLRKEYMREPGEGDACKGTRFVVSGEISSIYKQDGRVRKVHSLILLPGLEEAELLSKRLEAIGNIHSDGRPILGLSCRDLLEIMLETCPDGIFVPAHIWTPHFSMFGACSGFDTVEECFGDLAPHIHAVETGLSSDPPMNWRLSALDRFQLISNSDAHSPAKLGREANLLDTELSYAGLKGALETGSGLAGTIEFFPEEGKYHFDGHRKCHICMSPLEAESHGGLCPVCKKRMTMGVSHRIDQLADRPEGFLPERRKPFESLVPLPEVIAASTGRSAASKRVQEEYLDMLRVLGTEFEILREVPIGDIRRHFGRLAAEGIRRLRNGEVTRLPGFDGEYGTIRLFRPDELENPDGQMTMAGIFGAGGGELRASDDRKEARREACDPGSLEAQEREECSAGSPEAMEGGVRAAGALEELAGDDGSFPGREKLAGEIRDASVRAGAEGMGGNAMEPDFLARLNERQHRAAEHPARAIAVIAGPGTGKTGTLAARIRCLTELRRVKPSEITAVTFTNQAAGELKERLRREMPNRSAAGRIQTGTFHSICLALLKAAGKAVTLADGLECQKLAEAVIEDMGLKLRSSELLRAVSEEKAEKILGAGEAKHMSGDLGKAVRAYEERMREQGLMDFDDLLAEALGLLYLASEPVRKFCRRFRYLLVDEFQDISPLQYRLILAWNREGDELFVIGDPDQSIYGFRGSDPECFARLMEDFPETEVIRLRENYRSTAWITTAACGMISKNPGEKRELLPMAGKGLPVRVLTAPGRRSEGIAAAREINRMVGGIDMLDAGERIRSGEEQLRSFSDIAVLCRTNRQVEEMEEFLKTEGIPYTVTGKGSFLEAETVQRALGFFRALYGSGTGGSPEEEIWDQALLEAYRPLKKKRPAALVEKWSRDMGLAGDEAMEKLSAMAVFHKTMEEFLYLLDFGEEGDLMRRGGSRCTADSVSLMTLHGSKGLEFPAVILYGVRKNSIPLEYFKNRKPGSGMEEGDPGAGLQEERRLFYVGMTRAREELVLLTSGEPSTFLSELPEEALLRETVRGPGETGMKQLSLFDFM